MLTMVYTAMRRENNVQIKTNVKANEAVRAIKVTGGNRLLSLYSKTYFRCYGRGRRIQMPQSRQAWGHWAVIMYVRTT